MSDSASHDSGTEEEDDVESYPSDDGLDLEVDKDAAGDSEGEGSSGDVGSPEKKRQKEDLEIANPRALLSDMVQRLVERDVAVTTKLNENAYVLQYQRNMFSELALQGLCWSVSDGDITVKAASWEDTCKTTAVGMPRISLGGNRSRVGVQVQDILKVWLVAEENAWQEQNPRLKKLFLWRLHEHLSDKLRRLPYLCMACQSERGKAYPRWRPSACEAWQCQLKVREMSGDTLSIVTMAPQAVELELSFFAAACHSDESRRKLLFMLKSQHFSEFLKDKPDEGADWEKIRATLAKMPELTTLPKESGELQSALDAHDPLLFKLVRWVLNSAAGFLVKVEDPAFLEAVGIPKVFLFHPDNHEKLARFDALKAAAGVSVTYAFHGSKNFNWFTILRDGLVVASNTGLMSTGAAHGPGIYLGKQFGTSDYYCGSSATGASWSLGCGWRCMGLYQIAYTSQEDKNFCYVVTDAERVVLRALLVFNSGETCKMNAAGLGQALEGLALYQELQRGPLTA